MLSENQIKLITEFLAVYPQFKKGEAWGYDKDNKIIYSPINENKLKGISNNLPPYKKYVVINGKTIERIKMSDGKM